MRLFLRSRENSSNTIGIRFRELRALYNKAIEDNLVHEKNYPFKRFKVARFSKNVQTSNKERRYKKDNECGLTVNY